MKKIMSCLMALAFSFCLCCSLIPATLAAGESFHFYYEFDKEKYQIGDTVNVKVMVARTDSDEDFDLYSYSLNALFKEVNLEFVSSKATLSNEFRITDTPTKWNAGYQYVVLSYNGLGSHISGCKSKTEIATLTFKAIANVNGLVMDMLNPSIGVQPAAPTIEPTGDVGKTVIGDKTETYTVTFNRGTAPADSVADPTMDAQAESSQFALPQNPYTWENHSFLGWSDGKNTYQPGDNYTMPAENVSFTAQWKQDKYTISFQGGEGTTGEAPASEMKAPDSTFLMYTQGSLDKEGYTFAGWNDGEKTYQPGDSYTMPAKDVTFTAQWKKSVYTLSYDGNGATSGEAPPSTPQTPKTVISIPGSSTLKKTGYSFVGWSYNGTTYAPGSEFIMPEADVTFTAVWKQDSNGGGGGGGGGTVTTTYPVNITAPTNGSLTADKKAAEQGTTITITATPNQGYSLGKITVVDKDGKEIAVTAKDGVYTFTMPASAVTVSASFQQNGSKPSHDSCKKDESCPIYPFVDSNPKAWYHDGVHYCLDEGLMNGIGDKQFAPDLTTSRAMIVTILYRLEGKPATTVTGSYDDVPAGQWYSEAVSWADANGVVKGFGDGTFRPDDDITREQMATIFQRYAALKNKADGKKADLSGYTDAAEVSLWALEGMQWANGAGLIQGRTATTLAPGATATRAEAATILLRFCTGILK